MSKEEILNYFYTNSVNLDVSATLAILLSGLVIGAVISLTYWATYRGVAYNRKFNISLVVILLVSVVIMLMISSNIIISLGMVGALSIVRFRTAIKDSRDTVFIFWAIAEGLSVGSQNFMLAWVTTLFIAAVIVLLHVLPFRPGKYLLIVRCRPAPVDDHALEACIKELSNGYKLRAANRDLTHREMIFEVRTNKDLDRKVLDKLFEVDGVLSVHWVAESGETVG